MSNPFNKLPARLRIEPALGADLEAVVRKMLDLAVRLDVTIVATFNDTELFMPPNGNCTKMCDEYNSKSNRGQRIAHG